MVTETSPCAVPAMLWANNAVGAAQRTNDKRRALRIGHSPLLSRCCPNCRGRKSLFSNAKEKGRRLATSPSSIRMLFDRAMNGRLFALNIIRRPQRRDGRGGCACGALPPHRCHCPPAKWTAAGWRHQGHGFPQPPPRGEPASGVERAWAWGPARQPLTLPLVRQGQLPLPERGLPEQAPPLHRVGGGRGGSRAQTAAQADGHSAAR